MTAPFVTVIMPIRNEADFIARSFGAVLSQNYPHDRYEVLVADGMSDDGTRKIIGELAVQSDIDVRIIDNPGKIVPTGFNRALALARGEIIIRVDGHCEIQGNYLDLCVRYLAETGAECVGGVVETVGATDMARSIAFAMSSSFGVGNVAFRTMSDNKDTFVEVDTLAFGAYRRNVFERIGKFDEELVRNQDDEFNYRLRASGGRILLNPRIKSLYYSRSSLRKLARQYYQYGVYKIRVMQKHTRQMQPRQFIPPLLVIGTLGGLIVSPFSNLLFGLWLLALLIYFVANLLVSSRIAQRAGWRFFPLLFIIFPTLHYSYGLGFLMGLWKFRGRW